MLRRSRALLAIAICGIVLAAPAGAQPARGEAGSGSATPALPDNLPLKRDAAASREPPGPWLPVALLLAVVAIGGVLVLRRHSLAGWTRSWKGTGATRGVGITRLNSQALTAQASVHAVRWDGEEILLGCTAHAVTVLARRPLPSAEPERP